MGLKIFDPQGALDLLRLTSFHLAYVPGPPTFQHAMLGIDLGTKLANYDIWSMLCIICNRALCILVAGLVLLLYMFFASKFVADFTAYITADMPS